MSANIRSSAGRTESTTYTWSGEADRSTSVERVDGVITRTNEVLDPYFRVPGYWYQQPKGAYDWTSQADAVTVTATRAFIAGDLLLYSSANLPGLPGDTKSARHRFTNTGTAEVQIYGNIRAYSATGATGDGVTTPLTPVAPGQTVDLTLPSLVLPAGSTGYRPLFRAIMPEGAALRVSRPMYEGRDTPSEFFSAYTPNQSVFLVDDSSPALVLGYETARRGRSVFHDVLGGGQDVTLFPAALRTGTLRLLYTDEANAAAALAMHARPATFLLADPDRPVVAMTYAVDGDVRLALHENRQVWLLDVGYREVVL